MLISLLKTFVQAVFASVVPIGLNGGNGEADGKLLAVVVGAVVVGFPDFKLPVKSSESAGYTNGIWGCVVWGCVVWGRVVVGYVGIIPPFKTICVSSVSFFIFNS